MSETYISYVMNGQNTFARPDRRKLISVVTAKFL